MTAFGLRFVFLALVFVASPACGETIKNSAYRFTLNKPKGWHDVSQRTLADSARPVGNESRFSLMQTVQAAVVAFSKYKEPTDELNSVFVMFGVKVGAAAQSVPPSRFTDALLKKVAGTGAKVSIVSPTKATTVGGLPAAHARYHLDAPDGERVHKSDNEMWVFARSDTILIIQIQAKRDVKASGMAELRSAVRSIRFEP